MEFKEFNIRKLICHLFACLFLLSLNNVTITASLPQEEAPNDWWVLMAEINARSSAVKTIMPEYPKEAIERGIAGIAQVKIGIDKRGRVAKIKAQPGTDRLVSKAVVDAVKQWRFKLEPDPQGSGRYLLSRLTFHFIIDNGEGRVEMYNPPLDAPLTQQVNAAFSSKELREWKEWDEVWTAKKNKPKPVRGYAVEEDVVP